MSNTAGAGSNTAGSTGSTRTPPSFDAASILPVDQITAFTIADVTHDDRPEIIVLDGSPDASRQLAVVQANADRVLSTISGTNNVASYAVSLAVARLTPLYDPYQFIMTNPHYLDVGSINWDSSTGFGSAASWTNDIASTYILAVDINNDGKQDVIEVGPGTLVVMLGDGVGGFREPSYQFGDTHAGSFARTADFNEDGNVDVAQSGPAVVLGNGDGTFGPWNYLTSVSPDRQDVEVADFNNDGHTDVVAPTAAVCYNDAVALGLMLGLSQRGLRPGRDFALTGFDDIAEAAMSTPPLTTLTTAPLARGRQAAELLLLRLRDPAAATRRTIAPVQLVVRASSCPPATV